MKMIDQGYEILDRKDPLRLIEMAGRVCYKSEDKATDSSSWTFVEKIINSGHLSVIEHATAAFTVTDEKVQKFAEKEKFLTCSGPVVSGNYRRCSRAAHPQIRELMLPLLEEMHLK
jgi:hypothetical protein